MTNADAHMPDDIAREKDISRRLINEYRNALFGGLRRFRALRLQAPGIVVEFVLASVVSIFAVMSFLVFVHGANVVGTLPTIVACIKIVIIVVVCFWIAGRIWRVIGLANRDRCRYVVANMWSLAGSGFFILVLAIQIFYPEFADPPDAPPANISTTAVAPVPASAPVIPPEHERPQQERVFSGRGWQILRNDDLTYTTVTLRQASPRCALLGDSWILADRADFVGLQPELIEGGHAGSFWTASKKPNSNLDFFLNADGSSEFRWALPPVDARRSVLCIMAVAI